MTRGVIVGVVAVLAGPTTKPAAADSYRLANGLEIVLAPDPSAGSVVVHVWYRAGSDDGPAQLVERMLGHDSPHVDHAHFAQTLDALGGWDNATTAPDHTSVYEQLPPSALPLALFVEADRMFGAGEMMTAAMFERAAARTAPDRSDVAAAIHAAVWPHAAAPAPTLDLVRELWRDRFRPANAVLVVAGGFDPAATRRLIEHDFAWIASAPRTTTATTPVPLDASSTVAIASETGAPRVIVAARTDAPLSAAAIDVELAARILAGGRSSRLYRRLVMTDQIASDVGMSIAPHDGGGEVLLSVTARDASSAPAIAKAVSEEIAGLVARGVTPAELARAKTHAIAELVTALEDLSFRAEIVAAWTAYGGGDLGAFRARVDRVTAESVQRSAKIWLARTVTATVTP